MNEKGKCIYPKTWHPIATINPYWLQPMPRDAWAALERIDLDEWVLMPDSQQKRLVRAAHEATL